MSIEYELLLSDHRAPEKLLSAAGIRETPGLTLCPGPAGKTRVGIIQEAYGFAPNSSTALRLDLSAYNADDGYAGNYTVVRCVMAVLKVAAGDALLLFNYEKPLFIRRQGRLVLNAEGGWWQSPALLGLVDIPYQKESLPSL